MDTLFELLTYPIQRVVALLFSLSFDGTSIGALLVAALLLGILFKALVGIHLSVFDYDRRYKPKYDGKQFEKRNDFFTESGGL